MDIYNKSEELRSKYNNDVLKEILTKWDKAVLRCFCGTVKKPWFSNYKIYNSYIDIDNRILAYLILNKDVLKYINDEIKIRKDTDKLKHEIKIVQYSASIFGTEACSYLDLYIKMYN